MTKIFQEDAEKIVIGAYLVFETFNPFLFPTTKVFPTDFNSLNQEIFTVIQELHAKNKNFSMESVLAKKPHKDCTQEYLFSCVEYLKTEDSAKMLGEAVTKMLQNRRLKMLNDEVITLIPDEQNPENTLLQLKEMYDRFSASVDFDRFFSLKELTVEMESKPLPPPIPITFSKSLSVALSGGLYRGDVTQIVAPTGWGKSNFMVNLAYNVAQQSYVDEFGDTRPYRILYIQLEMTKYGIASRFLGRAMEHKSGDFRDLTQMPEAAHAKYHKNKDILNDLNINLTDTVRDGDAIIDMVDMACAMNKCDLLIVDHLGLIQNRKDRRMERWEVMSDFSDKLLACTVRNNIATVVANQYTKCSKEDQLLGNVDESNIKGGKDIMDMCSVVMLLHQDKEILEEEENAKNSAMFEAYYNTSCYCDIIKNRHGIQTKVKLNYARDKARFS